MRRKAQDEYDVIVVGSQKRDAGICRFFGAFDDDFAGLVDSFADLFDERSVELPD